MVVHNEGLINWQFSFNNHVSKKYIKKKITQCLNYIMCLSNS